MQKLAITLIEVGNAEAPNIGTIISATGSEIELKEKAIKAIESHFDSKVISITIQDGLGFTDVKNSNPLDASVQLEDESYLGDIEIQQTFIY